jgi:hypothetical protein
MNTQRCQKSQAWESFGTLLKFNLSRETPGTLSAHPTRPKGPLLPYSPQHQLLTEKTHSQFAALLHWSISHWTHYRVMHDRFKGVNSTSGMTGCFCFERRSKGGSAATDA